MLADVRLASMATAVMGSPFSAQTLFYKPENYFMQLTRVRHPLRGECIELIANLEALCHTCVPRMGVLVLQ